MTTLPKTFLTISIVGLALSLTGPGAEFAAGIFKPVSAIAFILFFITQILAKEIEIYDEEQHTKLDSFARSGSPASRPAADTASANRRSPSLAGAATR